ncbi:hypothetical protein [Haliangium ochraceum]|uniref:Uncharacterized protein n=1 Tax=Haliangium ochraceum (strain DSM 14365 / JCM 11303 / SMP-2) TaxID=502025 RepID=D0LR90_HALO1|nr:hypothetical protein [Haliangium ochraceum]ACY17118.1 hypothetical protein Hoch_4627 [Haliangium ochraceum DSM 14365]
MSTVLDVLTELSVDPFAREAWALDPSTYLDSTGMSAEQRALLAAPTQRATSDALAGGAWSSAAIMWDPGPDPVPEEYEED